MNTISKEKVPKENQFSIKGNGLVSKKLIVDNAGDPKKLECDASGIRKGGYCIFFEKERVFKKEVRIFMEALLKESIEDFNSLLDSLNPEYCQMAEEVCKEAAAKYNL